MRPVDPHRSSRLTIVIVPVVVVVVVLLFAIALSIARAVAQGIDETSSTLASTPGDDVDDVEGSAPSINKVIVVSSIEPVEPASVTNEQSHVQTEEPVASLPATGSRGSVGVTALAMIAAGAMAFAVGTRGVS